MMPRPFLDTGGVQAETESLWKWVVGAFAAGGLASKPGGELDLQTLPAQGSTVYVDTNEHTTTLHGRQIQSFRWSAKRQCRLKRGRHRVWVLNGVDEFLDLSANVEALKVPPPKKKPRKQGGQKEAVFILGGPATGKTVALRHAKTKFPTRLKGYVYVNTDDIMAQQPGYERLVHDLGRFGGKPLTDQEAANKYHVAAKEMAAAMFAEIIDKGHNVVFDGTGASAKKLKDRVTKLKARGYRVTAVHTILDQDTALERAQGRSDTSGRHVPDNVIRSANPGTDTDRIRTKLMKSGISSDNIILLDTSAETPQEV